MKTYQRNLNSDITSTPTIFLDIDGVLVTWRHTPSTGRLKVEFDPRCQSILEVFLQKHPDCQVVLSSTWRKSQRMMQRLVLNSPTIGSAIIGTTDPDLSMPRHLEIGDYLMHTPIGNYVVLDDEDMPRNFGPRTVQTHNTYGLQPYHVQQMEEILYGKATV